MQARRSRFFQDSASATAPSGRSDLGYPNFLLFNAPDRVYWYRILPTGPTTSSLVTTLLIRPEAKALPDYDDILQREIHAGIDFHLEDMEMCVATQRGIQSVGYNQGRLSHLEETIWQFQKYLASVIERAALH